MNLEPSQTRKEIMVEIIAVCRDAKARGEDNWKAVEKAFPGIPADVIADAFLEVEDDDTEAWWRRMERTIDGEVIRNALAKG